MHLERLSIVNFRNYTGSKIRFSPDLNLIYGLNAQGKTNLLEAIYLLCLGRSFRLAKNQELIKSDSSFFTIEGKIVLDSKIERTTVLRYIKDGKKEISIDRKKLIKHSKIFGEFPIVVMAPEEFKITSGGPSERRRFIDVLLSQISVSYLANLQEYNRNLKQRNKILQDVRDGQHSGESAIVPWTQRVVEIGTEIINARNKFVRDFAVQVESVYKKYTESKDLLEIFVDSTVPFDGELCSEDNFETALHAVRSLEKKLANTLIGPHRDELIFQINGMDLRKYGSRGEHKSVLLALKIAEYKYIKNIKKERPIILLDDCYSELDRFREENVFQSLKELGQIFVTSPKETILARGPDRDFSKSLSFSIQNGVIEASEN